MELTINKGVNRLNEQKEKRKQQHFQHVSDLVDEIKF